MAEHAILSASGAHRWLNCTPSARLEQLFPDRSGEFAQEGTFAHELAEKMIRYLYSLNTKNAALTARFYEEWLEKEGKTSEYYSQELVDYVEIYANMVLEKVLECKGELYLEQKLDFSEWVPDGFGRGDAVIISDNTLEICDLKYGRGVKVEAKNNPQLRLYALGAYYVFSLMYDIKTIRMTICQPRNGGISTDVVSTNELLAWGDKVRSIAKQAYEGKGLTNPGEWCRFCKAAPECKTLAADNDVPESIRKDPKLMTDIEMSAMLSKLSHVETYIKQIKAYALERAMEGDALPGWKLVAGRGKSAYADEQVIAKTLEENGYKPEQIYKPAALIGITEMKKLLGVKQFKELITPHTTKEDGKPQLAPEKDERPAINAAVNEFEDLGD